MYSVITFGCSVQLSLVPRYSEMKLCMYDCVLLRVPIPNTLTKLVAARLIKQFRVCHHETHLKNVSICVPKSPMVTH